MTRRRFAFWLGFGLFSLAEKLRFDGLDKLAAATMKFAEPEAETLPPSTPIHWRAAENGTWKWFEREDYIDGRWKVTGITTPINKITGLPYTGHSGYLDESLVPAEMRRGDRRESTEVTPEQAAKFADHRPDPSRRARHGRPPSDWLRSLHADELRIWLKTIDVPEADVTGMTFWEHLTRDHSFDPKKIAGLAVSEQAKLHAAAHFGY